MIIMTNDGYWNHNLITNCKQHSQTLLKNVCFIEMLNIRVSLFSLWAKIQCMHIGLEILGALQLGN